MRLTKTRQLGLLPGSVALRQRHPLVLRGGAGSVRSRVGRGAVGTARIAWDDAPAGPAVRDPRLARLEAVLFLAREPISTRKLGQLASLADGTEARTLVRRLNEKYDSQGCAFRVEQIAGGYQLLTRPQFASWLRRLYPTPVETRLSGPALETLAVVAYRQPVLRADIESIRGVQCAEMLRQLMERDLVRIVGRSEELGRPFLYGTTKRFLQVFGLRHLDELPRSESWRATLTQPLTQRPEGSSPEGKSSVTSDREEESDVKIQAAPGQRSDEQVEWRLGDNRLPDDEPRAIDDEDEFEDEFEDDDEIDDEDEDLDDEEDLEEDEWEEVDDEEEEDEEWDEEEDEDEWEEVDDEDDDWDDDDEDDEEWDDE